MISLECEQQEQLAPELNPLILLNAVDRHSANCLPGLQPAEHTCARTPKHPVGRKAPERGRMISSSVLQHLRRCICIQGHTEVREPHSTAPAWNIEATTAVCVHTSGFITIVLMVYKSASVCLTCWQSGHPIQGCSFTPACLE